MFKLLLLLTFVPFVELALIFRIHDLYAHSFGADRAFLLSLGTIILTGIVGAALARSQGMRLLRSIQAKAAAGEVPTTALVEGLLVLIGGILLLTPGYLTDLTGLLLILPPSRRALAKSLHGKLQGGMASGNVIFWGGLPRHPHRPQRSGDQGKIIDVDYEDHSRQ